MLINLHLVEDCKPFGDMLPKNMLALIKQFKPAQN